MNTYLKITKKIASTILLSLSIFLFTSYLTSQLAIAADMPVVDDATCWTCHPTFVTVNNSPVTTTAVYGGLHPTTLVGCTKCHATSIARNTKINYCTNCHYASSNGGTSLWFSQHGGDANFQAINSNRHQITADHQVPANQCGSCHLQELTAEHYRLGRTDTLNNPINCNTCHTGSFLGDEVSTNGVLKLQKPTITSAKWYAPVGRTISRIYIDASTTSLNGIEVYAQQLNGTWGCVYGRASGKVVKQWIELPSPTKGIYTKMYANSVNYNLASVLDVPKVVLTANNTDSQKLQTAIASNDTRCETCHGGANHVNLHNSGMDANCLGTCHNANLITEHINNVTTAGKGLTCDTCHAASAPSNVKNAIMTNDLDCAACHTSGHNMNFTQVIPADIPLYAGYNWSAPQQAIVFAGDPSAVSGYTGSSAKVVFSNRRSDVTVSGLWDYYNTQFTQKGWTLNSTPPATGASYFTAEFLSGSRAVTVRTYNTESANGVGSILSAGYRLEIWYK